MKKFQKFLVLSATVFGAWMLFGNANDAHAIVSTTRPSCAYEANNYTISVNWTEGSAPLGSYIVDISTSPTFDYVWNRTVASGNFSVSNVPVGFADSPWDAGTNPTPTLGLVAGTTYYVRLYNGVHNPNASPGVAFSVAECPAPAQPTVSGLPACATSAAGYGGTLNWSGGANPAYGYYVDISDNGFGRWWTKNLAGTSTSFPAGFNGYSGVSGAMGNLQPGVTYSARIFNGEHSTIRTFSVPMCVQPTCSNTSPNNYTVPYGTNSHTMYITTTNTTATHFAVIPPSGSPVWVSGVLVSPGYYSATIDLSTIPVYGSFTVDVYMDNAYYSGPTTVGCGFHPNFVRQSPSPATCTSVTPQGFITYNDFGTHTVDVNGVHSSATAVNIAVFRDGTSPYWYLSSTGQVQNLGGGLWRLTINLASHIPANYSGNINVHVYMDNPFQSNTGCGQANFQKQLRPATTAPSVTPSVAGACVTGPYTVTLNWTGQARPAGATLYTGYLIDAATVSNFSAHWNKNVPVGTNSTPAGTGFDPYTGVSGTLTLNPDTTYYFRVFNDSHSPTTSYSRPRCGSLDITVNQPGGAWTLNGPGGFTKAGTGAQSFNPTACNADSYYCIPIGAYTLVPTPNSPTGYNGTATPTNHNVN